MAGAVAEMIAENRFRGEAELLERLGSCSAATSTNSLRNPSSRIEPKYWS
jgi:hypothetical protein